MKKICAVLLSTLISLAAFAQAAPALLIGSDPVAFAVGGAAVARPADAFAVDNNAAAMSLYGGTFDVAAGVGIWAPQAASNLMAGLGTFYKVNDKFAIGLSGRMLRDKPYELTSATGQVTGNFTPMDIVAGLGLSYAVMDGLSLGVSARMVSSAIAPNMKGSAFGADLMAMYAKDAFSAALGVCNLGSSLSYGGESYALPTLVKAGGAYSVSGLTASAELDYLFSGALMAGLGVEYGIQDIFFLRGGFHYGDAAKALPTYASLGLGFKYAGFHADLAFLTASKTLGNTLSFSLGYAF
jgi:hypothetical protein